MEDIVNIIRSVAETRGYPCDIRAVEEGDNSALEMFDFLVTDEVSIRIADDRRLRLFVEDTVYGIRDEEDEFFCESVAMIGSMFACEFQYLMKLPEGYDISKEYKEKIRMYINRGLKPAELKFNRAGDEMLISVYVIPVLDNFADRVNQAIDLFTNQNVVSLLSKIKDNLVPIASESQMNKSTEQKED